MILVTGHEDIKRIVTRSGFVSMAHGDVRRVLADDSLVVLFDGWDVRHSVADRHAGQSVADFFGDLAHIHGVALDGDGHVVGVQVCAGDGLDLSVDALLDLLDAWQGVHGRRAFLAIIAPSGTHMACV